MQKIIYFFWVKLRLSKPWNSKIPFLISIPYFLLMVEGIEIQKALVSITAAILIIVGVAWFAYLLNDLGDRRDDKLIGKKNVTEDLKFWQIYLLLFCFLMIIFIPWIFLPFNTYVTLLIFLEIFLFYAYAMPPFRLKQKGWLGVIADSLYAHVIPALLASYTFYLISPMAFSKYKIFLSVLLLWQFVLGIRNIIFHQIQDYDNDIKTQSNTFVVKMKLKVSENFVSYFMIPLEVLAFLGFVGFIGIGLGYYLFLLVYILYVLIYTFKNLKVIKDMNYRQLAYLFLDDYYIMWMPVLTISLLVCTNVFFLFLFAAHCLLFKNPIRALIKTLV